MSGEAKARRKSNALVSMFSYSRGRLEKEGLLRRYVVEEELLDGCLSTSARGKVESGDMTRVRGEETDPCWPKRRIFVHWRSSDRAMWKWKGEVTRTRARARDKDEIK